MIRTMPDAHGFIDGLEGACVRGWAVSGGDRPAIVTIRDDAGRLLARGIAELDRPDIGRLGAPTACGFRVPVRRIGPAGLLHVFADATELTGSPLPVGPGVYDGALSVAGSVATGWITERTDSFRGATIQLRDQDGVILGEGDAVPGADAPDPLHATARFSIELRQACFGRADLLVRAFVNGTRVADTHCAPRLDGYLDALTPRRCGGWLLSPDAVARTLTIEVFRDGKLAGSGRGDLPREDLRDRYPHSSRVGFEITLDPPTGPSSPLHVYSVRLEGTETELFGGPFSIEDRPEGIEAARRIGRQALTDPAITEAEQTVLRRALASFIGERRHGAERIRVRVRADSPGARDGRRLVIVIPIYRGVEITRACVESVLRERDPARDAVVLVNDCSPDEAMAQMLEAFAREPDVFLLNNAENQGFVASANRGLAFCRRGDILLLNSDTRVFPGVLDELCRIAQSAPDIGTVTALSNNATLFSYPHLSLPNVALADMDWAEIAALTREANAGVAIDVPTGHGFCLLVRRQVLDMTGPLDRSFGRGYGEENDFCQRAADLGFRNVAAVGAFVEHREGISFGAEKQALVEANLARLRRMYPEYAAVIAEYERCDGLRRARWPLDAARLRKAGADGAGFALVVTNWLGGGSRKALADIEAAAGYGGAAKLALSCRADGVIELNAEAPALRAVFAPSETRELFEMLSAAPITRVLVHQVLGFPAAFLDGLRDFAAARHSVFYAHDFYPICPRVTMIDASGDFCDIAPPDTCRRCLAAAGAHEASRLDELDPVEHRASMGRLLGGFRHVVAPSDNAASYLRRAWPELAVKSVPHPEPARAVQPLPRRAGEEVLLFGAVGPHKGSATLLAIARRARLSHPDLRFRVIGHTDIDPLLREMGNVLITGSYEAGELPELIARASGRIALFLHNWPETYSYTLSEAVAHGLYPLVPDLGAPAERVRQAGWGTVFGFPIEPGQVLTAITEALGRPAAAEEAGPAAFGQADTVARHRELLGLEVPPPQRRKRLQTRAG
jgi:GT2 family glycosyltransferase/glycosyltransferase involved in cell wall biosynthesis